MASICLMNRNRNRPGDRINGFIIEEIDDFPCPFAEQYYNFIEGLFLLTEEPMPEFVRRCDAVIRNLNRDAVGCHFSRIGKRMKMIIFSANMNLNDYIKADSLMKSKIIMEINIPRLDMTNVSRWFVIWMFSHFPNKLWWRYVNGGRPLFAIVNSDHDFWSLQEDIPPPPASPSSSEDHG